MLRGLAGEAGAHASLFRELTGYLRGYFTKRLGRDMSDVDDLVQETLLAIHLKRETYDAAQPFTPWAYSVASYKLIDSYRRKKVRRTEPLDDPDTLFAAPETQEAS